MSEDNVMYDTPLEFVNDAIGDGTCAAQSVIPDGAGSYLCGCSCERWQITVATVDEGLRLARHHTAPPGTADQP